MQEVFRGTFSYKGFLGVASFCGLEIYSDNIRAVVLFTELGDNPGTSITNYTEQLASLVWTELLSDLDPADITWVEHYPRSEMFQSSWDIVEYEYNSENPRNFRNPRWPRRITHKDYRKLIKS